MSGPKLPPIPNDIQKAASSYRRLMLAEALRSYPNSPSLGGPELQVARAILDIEQRQRIALLLTHYGIEVPDGEESDLKYLVALSSLTLALARDFVPRFDVFRPPATRGRKTARPRRYGDLLVSEIEKKIAQSGMGISAVCRWLSKKGPWKDDSPKTLQNRYFEAKRQADDEKRNYEWLKSGGHLPQN